MVDFLSVDGSIGLFGRGGGGRTRSPWTITSCWMTHFPARMMCFGPRIEARREILLPVSWLRVSGWTDGTREKGEVKYGFDIFAANRCFGRHYRHLLMLKGTIHRERPFKYAFPAQKLGSAMGVLSIHQKFRTRERIRVWGLAFRSGFTTPTSAARGSGLSPRNGPLNTFRRKGKKPEHKAPGGGLVKPITLSK